jgi:F-type H+-transporting ATPase subunit b
MLAAIVGILAAEEAAEATGETVNEAERFYPHINELLVGLIAFAIVFFFIVKFVMPRLKQVLAERESQIQGNLEKADEAKRAAESELADYRTQLAGARDEANRIIEEARKTAEQLRKDIQAKAEEESQATVARAQEEIRAERDRAFQDLRAQVGEIAVLLAGKVVDKELDQAAHERLIDEYIDQVAASGNGNN